MSETEPGRNSPINSVMSSGTSCATAGCGRSRRHLRIRWLEECLAEAFAIRGLARLADGWERDPPFPSNSRYAQALRDYGVP